MANNNSALRRVLATFETNPSLKEAYRQELIAAASAAHANFPQYKGHWDDFVLVRVTATIKTVLGLAFGKGEIALAAKERHLGTGMVNGFFCDDIPSLTVYSVRNECDTIISPAKVEYL